MYYLEIILNLPVNQGFTYSYEPSPDENEELKPQIGKRAEIMFGNKKTEGFIINILDSLPEDFPIPKEKIQMIYVANGKAEGKDYDSIICIVDGSKIHFPMKYVKSLSNDEYGNIVIKLVPVDENIFENAQGDFGKTLELLLEVIF